ncbi:MAG: MATE family efflux transporter [Clostridia bacterium]|nr:MATE family efflux transporter [Clostridia bacterium]
MARTRDLTDGKPSKLILSFAAPLLFGFLFQQLYNIVDAAIVGRVLGAEMLGAVGCTGSVNFLVLGFCMGICSGFAIPVAQCFGAKDEYGLRCYVFNSVYLCAGIAVVMALATTLLCPAILRLMGTPEEILPAAVSYISVIFAGIPAMMLYNMAGGILRSLGDSRTPVIFLVMASLINVALDFLLILKANMGVAGASVATVISQICSGIGCTVVLIRRFPILRPVKDERRFRAKSAKRLLGIGLPMGLQFSITAIGTVIVQTAVNSLGTAAVAAVAAGVKVSTVFTCAYDALSSAMATFAGQNIGAGKPDRVTAGLKSAGVIGTVYSVCATAAIWLFGRTFIGVFLDPGAAAEVTELAYRYLRVNSALYIPLLFVNIVRLAIQGMGYTTQAMMAGVFEMVARSLVALLLVPPLGYPAACCANPAAWVAADIYLIPCYTVMIRRVKRKFQARAAVE